MYDVCKGRELQVWSISQPSCDTCFHDVRHSGRGYNFFYQTSRHNVSAIQCLVRQDSSIHVEFNSWNQSTPAHRCIWSWPITPLSHGGPKNYSQGFSDNYSSSWHMGVNFLMNNNLYYQTRGLETSRNLTIRRLNGWILKQDPDVADGIVIWYQLLTHCVEFNK